MGQGIEKIIHGSLHNEGLEVVLRDNRLFLRYDAGAHMVAWREDEISAEEFAILKMGKSEEYEVLLNLQKRIQLSGVDPYRQNWTPERKYPSTN